MPVQVNEVHDSLTRSRLSQHIALTSIIMKEALVNNGPSVQIIDSPIPKAGPGQLVIKVEVCGSNPKDWKLWWIPEANLPINMGDDIAGTVHQVGDGVTEFAVSSEHPVI